MDFFQVALVCLFVGVVTSNSGYKACGGVNSADVNRVIDLSVDRLMHMRHPDWGWTNTAEVVLGLQLSAQKKFFERNQTIETMKDDVSRGTRRMNLGQIALYVLAVKSVCQDPRNFSGTNLVKILNKRAKQQFYYDGKRQAIPLDRFYRYSLALGALCVDGFKVESHLVKRLLKNLNGSQVVDVSHSVDDAAQILLALQCLKTEDRTPFLRSQISKGIDKMTALLEASVKKEGENTWIGNKFSSPSSVLALGGAGVPEEKWNCTDVMKGLATDPESLDKEGGLSQRLPALAGFSYLDLTSNWTCVDPAEIPDGYEPSCDPAEPESCMIQPELPGLQPPIPPNITVYLSVVVNPPEPGVNITVKDLPMGSTLFEAMTRAKEMGYFTFESKSFSFGQFITSILGVEAHESKREYWSLIDGKTGKPLSLGASSYVMQPGELIVFKIKTW